MSTSPLRDALLASLASLPASRVFHLHSLLSVSRRQNDLFPHAQHHPKTHVQDILILLSEQPTAPPSSTDAHTGADAQAPRVLVCAIEAQLYSIPSTASAILYISKVDSTGQCIYPSPLPTLLRAFLGFYAAPATRPARTLWIHLFARAQGQYLFPNSAEHPGKHPLSDVKLCRWWKTIISEVARQHGRPGAVKLFYLLPGYSSLEASRLLSEPLPVQSSNASPSKSHHQHNHQWLYTHPYSQHDLSSPFGSICDGPPNIAELIPSFPDDPKTRFMAELVADLSYPSRPPERTPSPPASPTRKRQRTNETTPEDSPASTPKPLSQSQSRSKPASLAQPSGRPPSSSASSTSPSRPKRRKSTTPHLSLSADEFWERMAFRQECAQGALTGFFTAVFSDTYSSSPAYHRAAVSESAVGFPPQIGEIWLPVHARIVASLLNLDFSNEERAKRATAVLEEAIRGLLCSNTVDGGEVSSITAPNGDGSGDGAVDGDGLGGTNDLSPTSSGASRTTALASPRVKYAFDRGVFETHIYGSIRVDNPPLPPRGSAAAPQPKVNVLQAKKKKRPVVPAPAAGMV
ncbi:hypothetical protein BOTBODRAFT_26835 [Botryobasidium botryosum FD-172 SS1]|uniref:histone acetyltransferase n=1 Tax=Botryobasidium botryosum (strain FD-172 SS1) TaxID=930990 RepID=A0A067MZ18_BOTB1|nr:hypothetical protein BOTBODRAFT_26835 [Botryobasidium botryosum FD-172 SS1]